jgi:hypothetical protein
MRWNNRTKVERPEYPKLIPIPGTAEEVRSLLPLLLESDSAAEIVDGGSRGLYVRVHNEAAETAARHAGEGRSFPLA